LTTIGNFSILIEISEDKLVKLSIIDFADGERVLSGVQAGRQLLGKLVAAARPPDNPEPAYLDFEGVEVATASFLREGVIAFRDHARSTLPALYPVIANASPAVIEELEFFLRHRRDALWACQLTPSGEPREPKIVGELDEAHQSTFDLVARLKSASAPGLAAQSKEGLAPTAWNNRLSSLAARGLLIERRSGKTKTFAPVLEIA
jgi:hypothetical protein